VQERFTWSAVARATADQYVRAIDAAARQCGTPPQRARPC